MWNKLIIVVATAFPFIIMAVLAGMALYKRHAIREREKQVCGLQDASKP